MNSGTYIAHIVVLFDWQLTEAVTISEKVNLKKPDNSYTLHIVSKDLQRWNNCSFISLIYTSPNEEESNVVVSLSKTSQVGMEEHRLHK